MAMSLYRFINNIIILYSYTQQIWTTALSTIALYYVSDKTACSRYIK